MGTIAFRLDRETERILRDLAPGKRGARSQVIRAALKAHWETVRNESARPFREIYAALGIRPEEPTRDRAQHAERLRKEILIAKRRKGTL